MRFALLVLGALALPIRAADFDYAFGRTHSLITRNAQDQQFVQDRAQTAQTLLRIEESRRLNAQSYVRLPIGRSLDLVQSEDHAASEQVQKRAQQIEQLSTHLGELEDERRALMHTQAMRRAQRIVVD